jgi:hypothetical protein
MCFILSFAFSLFIFCKEHPSATLIIIPSPMFAFSAREQLPIFTFAAFQIITLVHFLCFSFSHFHTPAPTLSVKAYSAFN